MRGLTEDGIKRTAGDKNQLFPPRLYSPWKTTHIDDEDRVPTEDEL